MRKGYVSRLLGLSRREVTAEHLNPVSPLAPPREPPIYLGDRKLLVHTKWGGCLVVPTYNFDVAIGPARDGVIEPWTTRLIQELVREGDVVINAGANFGYYTVLSAYLAGQRGKVIAIEANPHIIPYLISSCYWAGVPNHVEIYNRAAWHRSGETLKFRFSPATLGGGSARELWSYEENCSLVTTVEEALWNADLVRAKTDQNGRVVPTMDSVMVEFTAQTCTIDDICSEVPRANLIHMDIEGAESFALQGAKRLIDRSPDIRVVFEWSASRYENGTHEAREAFKELWEWLGAAGFRVRELYPRAAEDGAIYVSEPLEFDYLTRTAAVRDFVATRSHNDPWINLSG